MGSTIITFIILFAMLAFVAVFAVFFLRFNQVHLQKDENEGINDFYPPEKIFYSNNVSFAHCPNCGKNLTLKTRVMIPTITRIGQNIQFDSNNVKMIHTLICTNCKFETAMYEDVGSLLSPQICKEK